MRQSTARMLLVLLLVGVFAPAALAFAAPSPHACCMRKGMHEHNSSLPQIFSPNCCGQNCCRPLTVSHFAEARPAAQVALLSFSYTLRGNTVLSQSLLVDRSPRSERAPPESSN